MKGFVPALCYTLRIDQLSDEGAAETVEGECLLCWVKENLCPILGSYQLGEARSVVLMQNTSTCVSDNIEKVITATCASIIYSALFSSYLNPIE